MPPHVILLFKQITVDYIPVPMPHATFLEYSGWKVLLFNHFIWWLKTSIVLSVWDLFQHFNVKQKKLTTQKTKHRDRDIFPKEADPWNIIWVKSHDSLKILEPFTHFNFRGIYAECDFDLRSTKSSVLSTLIWVSGRRGGILFSPCWFSLNN